MQIRYRRPAATLFCLACAGVTMLAADWPHWRGPGAAASRRGEAPGALERHGERRVEGADRRRRRLVADRHAAIACSSRRRSAPASAARATIRGSCRARTPAARGSARSAAAARRGRRPARRSSSSRRSTAPTARGSWEHRIEAAGPLHAGPRQAQPREPEPGDRRPDGLRVVRHRPDRRARHERQGRLAAAPRQGDLAVRHQLGALELADAVRRLAASCSAITRRRRTCSRSTSGPARSAGRPIAARDGCPTARRSSSRRRPGRS